LKSNRKTMETIGNGCKNAKEAEIKEKSSKKDFA
jgi:hypothetical protein